MTDVFPDLHASGVPYGQLYPSACKEQISVAVAQSIATAARCKVEEVRIDDETVDLTIRQVASHTLLDHSQLDVQLKCTSSAEETVDVVKWSLKKRSHDHLRSERRLTPIILVVIVVPADFATWMETSTESIQLATRGYWISLRGELEIDKDSRTVEVPKSNVFDIEGLLKMMKRIGDGGTP